MKSAADFVTRFDGNVDGEPGTALRHERRPIGGRVHRLKPNGEVFFKVPRRAVLRSVLLNHLIHHRGQLTVYLRENDVPLPSIYGPTADEGIKR